MNRNSDRINRINKIILIKTSGESVSGLDAYRESEQITEEEFQKLDTLAYKLENGLVKLVESRERKKAVRRID